MPVSKLCVICEKEFSVPPVRAETAKTCSQKCRGVLIAHGYQEKRVGHRCPWCDIEFFSPKSHADRRTYCSVKCADEAKAGVMTGPRVMDGTATMHSAGYALERSREHPFAVNGSVMQHRLVMEQWMREDAPTHHFLVEIEGQKYLRREIHVHHRNRVKTDNARGNLQACTNATHKDIHSGRPVMKGTSWPEDGGEIDAVQRTWVKPCEFCAAPVKVKLSSVMRGGGKFCSKSCAAKSRNAKQKP